MNQKTKNRKLSMYARRAIQVLSLLLLPSLFIQIFSSLKAIVMFVLHSQGTIQTIIPNMIILAVATLVTAIGGRFFCGWMCAFGSFGDLLYRLPRVRNKNPKKYLIRADRFLKWLKYLILAFIMVLIWGVQVITIPAGWNPWDLFGILSAPFNLPAMDVLMPMWLPATFLLLLIITGSLFIERFFCRYLCPLGAYFSIISRLRAFNIVKKNDGCGQCTLCTKKCSMGIPLGKMEKVSTGECIQCLECTTHCPRGIAHTEMSGTGKNVLVAGTVSCALVAGSYYLGNHYQAQVANSSEAAASDVVYSDAVAEVTDTTTEVTDTTTEVTDTTTANSDTTAGAADTTAETEVNLADGTYSGSGTGFRGETTVTVEVTGGKISDIAIDSYQDDDEFFNRASTTIIQEILSNQSVEVDAVSGATYSSNGIKEAVANALSMDYTASPVQEGGQRGGHRRFE